MSIKRKCLVGLSTLVALGLIALSLRALDHRYTSAWTTRDGWECRLTFACMEIDFSRSRPVGPGRIYSPAAYGRMGREVDWKFLVGSFKNQSGLATDSAGAQRTYLLEEYALAIWFPIMLCLIAPGMTLARFIRRSRRAEDGLCLHCGYNLRFQPGACPECGQTNG